MPETLRKTTDSRGTAICSHWVSDVVNNLSGFGVRQFAAIAKGRADNSLQQA